MGKLSQPQCIVVCNIMLKSANSIPKISLCLGLCRPINPLNILSLPEVAALRGMNNSIVHESQPRYFVDLTKATQCASLPGKIHLPSPI